MKKKALELTLGIKLDFLPESFRVKMDSRQITKGDIFIAIMGGNKFVETALENGADFVVCSDSRYMGMKKIFVVNDTILFMQNWARNYLENIDILKIAITGSNGKTTTKDIIFHLLSKRKRGIKTLGNYNNNIGLPFTVLQIEKDDEFAVFEMGMSNFGEIDLLGSIVKPDISCISNIGDSHLEFLKSRNGVFKAKTEILKYTKSKVILNGDDEFLKKLEGIKIGFDKKNDYTIDKYEETADGIKFSFINNGKATTLETNLNGKHNLYNLLMAGAVITELGYKINEDDFLNINLTGMRFEKIEKENIIFINDAYNASPISMKYALESFENLYNNRVKIIVLGDMLELGELSYDFHASLFDLFNKIKFDYLYLYGNEMKALYDKFLDRKRVFYFYDKTLIKSEIYKIKSPCAVLLKGSRGMRLEEII
jgi:UDP-N-acetylmuramoyl-tripeptide--D-alanyl-D-alanine ligase